MRTVRVLPFSESFAAGLGIAPVVIACRYYCLRNLKLAFLNRMRDRQGWFTSLAPFHLAATALSSSLPIVSSMFDDDLLDTQSNHAVVQGFTDAAAVSDASSASIFEDVRAPPHVAHQLSFNTPALSSAIGAETREFSEAKVSVVINAGQLAAVVVVDSFFVVSCGVETASVLHVAVDSIAWADVQSCPFGWSHEISNQRQPLTAVAAGFAENAAFAVADEVSVVSMSTYCSSPHATAAFSDSESVEMSQPKVRHHQSCGPAIVGSSPDYMSLPNCTVSPPPEAACGRATTVSNQSPAAAEVPLLKPILSLRERMAMCEMRLKLKSVPPIVAPF